MRFDRSKQRFRLPITAVLIRKTKVGTMSQLSIPLDRAR
ncbi:unnamed protein product, partial [Adineta ricciae]